MDDPKSTTDIEAGEPFSTAQAVERLLAGAAEALARAADCNDADLQKFHLGTATAYKEWALQLQPLVSIQARIDEKTAMIRHRFKLGPLPRREVANKPDAREPEDVITAPETIAASSDLSPPPGGHDDYDVDDVEAFKAHVDAMFAIKPSTTPASTD